MSDVHDNTRRYSCYKANFNIFRHCHSVSMALLLSSFFLSFPLFLSFACYSFYFPLLKKNPALSLFKTFACDHSIQSMASVSVSIKPISFGWTPCSWNADVQYERVSSDGPGISYLCFRGTGTHVQACLGKHQASLLRKNEASVVMYSIHCELNEKGQQGCLTHWKYAQVIWQTRCAGVANWLSDLWGELKCYTSL